MGRYFQSSTTALRHHISANARSMIYLGQSQKGALHILQLSFAF